jgi:hypothetical protein
VQRKDCGYGEGETEMKLIYNAVKESKTAPRYPEVLGSFENHLDAITFIEEERLKMENAKFNFYVHTVKGEREH